MDSYRRKLVSQKTKLSVAVIFQPDRAKALGRTAGCFQGGSTSQFPPLGVKSKIFEKQKLANLRVD